MLAISLPQAAINAIGWDQFEQCEKNALRARVHGTPARRCGRGFTRTVEMDADEARYLLGVVQDFLSLLDTAGADSSARERAALRRARRRLHLALRGGR
ncbi:MAG: hypothetical protein GWN58_35305 [Anaerolineae bacterium]|nr:hypothetical protein [Anaerolineae bacterium]